MTNLTESYLSKLLSGQSDQIFDLFAEAPVVDHPEGRFEGQEAVARFVTEKSTWFHRHSARIEPFKTTHTKERTVHEALLYLTVDEREIDVPVAVVGQHLHTDKLDEVRVYHSTWPYTGSHIVRSPLLPEDPKLVYSDVIQSYQEALATANLEGAMATYEEDAYAREPSGSAYKHQGKSELRQFYGALFEVGAIRLRHCSITDDGVCCAIEYYANTWGDTPITPQAGVAVYERGTSGLLAASRIYDDIAVEEGIEGQL